MKKSLRQHCFPRASMRDQRDVAKKLGGILFHEKALPIQMGCKSLPQPHELADALQMFFMLLSQILYC
jgi:hypothetical protein